MNTSPYLIFSGNCEDAIRFYEKTFWNKCYAELEDKFGLKWSIMIEEE